MPVEIRELIIKATIALDWENQTVQENQENIVCLRLPGKESIATYVEEYFRQHEAKELKFDQSTLTAFLVEWQDSLLK
ncbi:MAG: DUF5908 family protein [Ginsengibacter sp.]